MTPVLEALCSSLNIMNMPCMSQPTYIKYEGALGEAVAELALGSLLEAGREEKEWAVREGSVDARGVPHILTSQSWGTACGAGGATGLITTLSLAW